MLVLFLKQGKMKGVWSVMAYVYNPSAWEDETDWLILSSGQPRLNSEQQRKTKTQ